MRRVISFLENLIRPLPSPEELRKHSPQGNFLVMFDCNDRIQALKRQMHAAETPEQFEEAALQFAACFYNEGYEVSEAAA